MSTYFNIYLPLSGQDQDAPPVANDKFLVVCDGLGGSGSDRHSTENGEIQKSAYLGSRKLSEICTDFFTDNYNELLSEVKIKSCIEELKLKIQAEFNEYLIDCPKVDASQGGKVFPTTLAAVVYKEESEYIKAGVIWAGDSRVYVVSDTDWLQQLSRDDVEGEFDACFGKDCGMSNCISQDQPFTINYACYNLPKNSVIFACSDGCFDFTSSPMFLELKILEALFKTNSFNCDMLSESFSNVFKGMNCGDDCTLSGVVFNSDMNEMREAIRQRVGPLKELIKEYNDSAKVYQQTTNDRKTEIRALMSENKVLSAEITSEKRHLIFSAFKEKTDSKDDTYKDKNLLNVSSFLETAYKPYSEYLDAIRKDDERIKEKQKEERQLVEEYKDAFDRFKTLVIRAEKEKRFKEKNAKKSRSHLKEAKQFIESLGSKKNTSKPDVAENDPKAPYYACVQEIEELLTALEDVNNINRQRIERFGLLAENLMYLLNEIDAEFMEEAMKNEKVKAKLLPEKEYPMLLKCVKDKGIDLYRGVISEMDFDDLMVAYSKYVNLGECIASINPDDIKEKSFDEKLKHFETVFLSVNLFQMSECLGDFDELDSFIPENVQYKANQEKLDRLQKELDSGKETQRKVWLKYKNNYEHYKDCCYSGEV